MMIQTGNLNKPTGRLKIAVGVATVGRRKVLSETVKLLASQNRLPDQLIICPVSPNDVDLECTKSFPIPVEVLFGPTGLPAQRNVILAACSAADVVVFFDDDFFAEANYLAEVEKAFLTNSGMVALTGSPIVDGIKGPGISTQEGLEILRQVGETRAGDGICD
jgi:hypothetical protein